MNKVFHYIYWLKNYLVTIYLPRLGCEKGYKRDWMTWEQYKNITNNLTKKLNIK